MVSPCAFNLQFSSWLKTPHSFSPAPCSPFPLCPLPKYTADSPLVCVDSCLSKTTHGFVNVGFSWLLPNFCCICLIYFFWLESKH